MSKTIAYDHWDEASQNWRHFIATFNPSTGVYDLNITETDDIGIPLVSAQAWMWRMWKSQS